MKRFTETEKWRDTWFRKLPSDLKLAYLFVVDNCDACGVWDPDFELADFQLGMKVDWEQLIVVLGSRLHVTQTGKWWLRKFIEFQYGTLSDGCKPHANVIRLLKSHTLWKEYAKGIQRDKEKEKDKEQEKEKDPEAVTPEQIYEAYPRKQGKQEALKAISKAIDRTSEDEIGDAEQFLLDRTTAYANATALWPEAERQFIPHPATWFNRGSYDDDPTTWQRTNFSQPKVKAASFA